MRIALFVYEVFRLILLLGVFMVLEPFNGSSGSGVLAQRLFPYILYVVPQALFPLMTYFIWMRLSLYQAYIPLYMAGKTISLVAVLGWCVCSLQILLSALSSGAAVLGLTLFLAAADAFALCGGVRLQTKLNRLSRLTALPGGGI
ncbi:MAG: hypothetical protein LBQ30_02395 [Treponema sp.]|nr:hypothetical protein [Treponema sp.]